MELSQSVSRIELLRSELDEWQSFLLLLFAAPVVVLVMVDAEPAAADVALLVEAEWFAGDAFELSIHEVTYFRRASKVFGFNASKSISTLDSSSHRSEGSVF